MSTKSTLLIEAVTALLLDSHVAISVSQVHL